MKALILTKIIIYDIQKVVLSHDKLELGEINMACYVEHRLNFIWSGDIFWLNILY